VGLSENRVPRKNGLIIIITWNKHVLFVALKSSHFQTRMFFFTIFSYSISIKNHHGLAIQSHRGSPQSSQGTATFGRNPNFGMSTRWCRKWNTNIEKHNTIKWSFIVDLPINIFYIKHLNLKYAKWVFDRSKHSWFKHIERTDHEFGCGWKWWLTSKIAMSTIGGSLFSDRPLEMSPGRNSKPSHCWLPFGKRLHNEVENHHVQWVNPRMAIFNSKL
jgi:hypothetical protein